MLFSTTINVTETSKISTVIFGRIKNANGIHRFSMNQILGSATVANDLAVEGDRIALTSIDDFNMPFLTSDKAVEVTPMFAFCLRLVTQSDPNSPEFLKIVNQITGKFKAFVSDWVNDDTLAFIESCLQVNNYMKGTCNFEIKVPQNYLTNIARTNELKQKMNSNLTAPSYVKSGMNKSRFMSTPKDDVYIEIPRFEVILRGNMDNDDVNTSMMPSRSSIMSPYRNPKLYRPNFDLYLGDTPKEYVVGNVKNNDLPIQPNEQEYYEALKDLISFGIKNKDNIPGSVEAVYSYLMKLANTVASWNWSHTGLLPVAEGIDDGDDNDTDVYESKDDVKENLAGSKEFIATGKTLHDFAGDGQIYLQSFIQSASEKDIYAPAEAIVKLLRWGERKPTRLKLSGSEKYFDLNKFISVEGSGDWESIEVQKVSGYTYTPITIVMADGSFADAKYLVNCGYENSTLGIPVGIICSKKFVNNKEQLVVFSMVDIIKELRAGTIDIAGFKLEGDNVKTSFHVDLSDADEDTVTLNNIISIVETKEDGSVVFNRSSELKDFYLEFKALTNMTSHMSILDSYIYNINAYEQVVSYRCEDREDLNIRLTTDGKPLKPCLDATIADKILPVIFYVANKRIDYLEEEGDEPSVERYLQYYYDAILKYPKAMHDGFDSTNEQSHILDNTTNSSAVNSATSSLLKMSSFDEQDNKEKVKDTNVPVKEEPKSESSSVTINGIDSIIESPSETDTFVEVYDARIPHSDLKGFFAEMFNMRKVGMLQQKSVKTIPETFDISIDSNLLDNGVVDKDAYCNFMDKLYKYLGEVTQITHTVGYMVIKDHKFYLVKPDSPLVRKKDKKLNISKVLAPVMQDYIHILKGEISKTRIRFDSEETMNYYLALLQKES